MATARSPLNLQLLPGKQPEAGRLARGGLLSLVIHTAVIAAAIDAAVSARHAAPPAALGRTVVLIGFPEPMHETPPPPALDVPLKGFQAVTAPTVLLIAVPPVNLREHFDLKDFSGVSLEGETAAGVVPAADQVCDPSLLDDPPILLLSPPLVSPPLLPQAGFTGHVVVEAVIDTTGRAEPASVRVFSGVSPAFDQPSRQWMLNALFRPARMRGRPVRVLIYRALDYAITGQP